MQVTTCTRTDIGQPDDRKIYCLYPVHSAIHFSCRLTKTRLNNTGIRGLGKRVERQDMIVLWGSLLGLIVQLPCVTQVLFDELRLDTRLPDKSKSISRTVAGREKSTSEAVLKRLTAVHPLPALVLEHRQV